MQRPTAETRRLCKHSRLSLLRARVTMQRSLRPRLLCLGVGFIFLVEPTNTKALQTLTCNGFAAAFGRCVWSTRRETRGARHAHDLDTVRNGRLRNTHGPTRPLYTGKPGKLAMAATFVIGVRRRRNAAYKAPISAAWATSRRRHHRKRR